MTALKAILVTVLAAVVIAAGVMWAIDQRDQPLPPAPRPTPVVTDAPNGVHT